jgi:RNA-binding protein
MSLSGKALRHLRALGHELEPLVQIGKGGVTPALVAQTRAQLEAHELIKVRVATEAPLGREDAAAELAAATESELAQVIGRTFLLYKAPDPKALAAKKRKPKIVLPK